jgi:hypothetical protein
MTTGQIPQSISQIAGPPPATPAELEEYKTLQDALLNVFADDLIAGPELPPLLPNLLTYQTPDIIANERRESMLVFDQPLPGMVWWAEYDPDLAQLIFVTVSGQIFGFGVKIHESVDRYLRNANMIYLVQVDKDGKMVNAEERKLVVRYNGRLNWTKQ